MWRERVLVRWAPLPLLGLLGVHLLAVAVWTRGLTALYDLRVYRAGGRAVLAGEPLYDGKLFWELRFTYPPFASVAFTPLAPLPVWVAKLAFTALNVVALWAVVWLSLRALGRPSDRRTALVAVALTGPLFWLEPVRSTIDIGQVNLLLMLLVLWDLTRGATARYQGIGVGIAAGVKLIPGFFVLYLLLTSRTRAALVAGGTFLGTVAVGFAVAPADSAHYWGGTFLTTSRIGETAETGNQSLAGLLARLVGPSLMPSQALWLLVALPVGAAGLALARWAYRRGEELLGVTLCGMTGCLVSPFAWSHHWVWFVPMLVVLAAAARAGRVPWPLPLGLYLLLVDWPVVLSPADGLFPPRSGIIALPNALARNVYVLLGLALLAWYALRARRGSTPDAAADAASCPNVDHRPEHHAGREA